MAKKDIVNKKKNEVIKEAKTVIWNGPMGFSEISTFANGTIEVAKALAANEEAVALFLDEKIEFYRIGEIVKSVFDNFEADKINSVDDILVADKRARDYVKNLKLN